MQIQIDSREKAKAIQNILKELDNQKVDYFSSKLYVGDYMSLDNPRLVIDRKQNLGEVCTNLCSKDNSRFWDELRRAHKAGIKLIFLVEHSNQIKSIPDVAKWSSKYSTITGRQLIDKMFQVAISYSVDWEFCDKLHTGRRIIELLGGEVIDKG